MTTTTTTITAAAAAAKPTTKDLWHISYRSRVIAHFVSDFVTHMAAKIGTGSIPLAAFDGPFPKTPYRRKNIADIFYTSRGIADFVPNFEGRWR